MRVASIIKVVGLFKQANEELKQKVKAFLSSEGEEYGEDREVVLEAMKSNPYKYEYAFNFFGDKEIMLTAIRGAKNMSPSPLSMVSEHLTDDTELVREAVSMNSTALEYASARLRGDKKFVLPILEKAPWSVRFLSDELKDDIEIGALVYKKDPTSKAMMYLSERLQSYFLGSHLSVSGIPVEFISPSPDFEKEFTIKQIKKGFEYIRASDLPHFSKVLSSQVKIYCGEREDLQAAFPRLNFSETTIGGYNENRVFLNMSLFHRSIREIAITIVHEFAHFLHDKYIQQGYDNQEFKDLYEHATMDRTHCELASLPKLGSPLSNILRGGFWWDWTVRRAFEDLYLKEIIGDTYIYRNKHKQEKRITKQELLKMITCPSQYAGQDEKEFFAEMATLITLKVVKPAQKVIAYRFKMLVDHNIK